MKLIKGFLYCTLSTIDSNYKTYDFPILCFINSEKDRLWGSNA